MEDLSLRAVLHCYQRAAKLLGEAEETRTSKPEAELRIELAREWRQLGTAVADARR